MRHGRQADALCGAQQFEPPFYYKTAVAMISIR